MTGTSCTHRLPAICLLLYLMAAISSCSHGNTYTEFTPLSPDSGGNVRFTLNMTDTACTYTISLIVRLHKSYSGPDLDMGITLTSPSGSEGHETVSYPSDYNTVKSYLNSHPEDTRIRLASSPDYYDISWEYRTGIVPPEAGIWEMEMNLPEDRKAILGAGVSLGRQTTENSHTH